MKRVQQGFTLIELIMVIVIIGVLSATAVPKFINIKDDALTATLEAVKGSMESVKTMVHVKVLIGGNVESLASTVNVDGTNTVGLIHGYPDEQWVNTWEHLLDIDAILYTAAADVSKHTFVAYPGDAAYGVVDFKVVPVSSLVLTAAGVAPATGAVLKCYASYLIKATDVARTTPPLIKIVDC
jgi:MSHA pilin protein MshA